MTTTTNPFDTESVDPDTESGMWAEDTPETNYFKLMMQDNETGKIAANDRDAEDSVLGGATLASMMGKDKKDKMDTAPTVPHQDPSPAETLSIVGIEDDVSTIANDTVNETTKAFFNKNGTREATQPRIRLFKEYQTPEKPRKTNEVSTPDDDDETTPETPPGMIRVRGRSSQTPEEAEAAIETKKKKKPSTPPVRSKRVYIVAGVLAVVLFASIIALSVALSGMRDKNSNDTVVSAEEGTDILDTWPDLGTEDQGNGEGDETSTDPSNPGTDSLSATTPAPASSSPAVGPPPPPLDTEATLEELAALLLNRGAISEDILDTPNSPQFQAMVWLSEDPNFYNYLESRMIQRWTLAVLSYSMEASVKQGPGRPRRGLLPGWLEYTDECTWFTSGEIPPCDESGTFQRLNIQQLQLEGSLAKEIAFLSNSLQYMNLDGNNLQGVIPTELGLLTLLQTLSIRENSFVGTMISEIGLLIELDRLNLGGNQLSGNIPTEIGNLASLEILRLDHNMLSGSIPSEIGNLAQTLTSLNLNNNFLTGTIPTDLNNLGELDTLYIGDNNLSGELPQDFCMLSNLDVVSVDCDAHGCQCCTECADEIDEPSEAPSVATAPSQAPSVPVTSGPTLCVDAISTLDACVAPGEDINATFSNCNPQDDDWVGVYAAGVDSSSLPNPPVWSWACGSRNCREAVSSQEMLLSSVHAATNAWPLGEGAYILVLARNSAQPYTAFAVSAEFSVQEGC